MRTGILCTIGPATNSEEMIVGLASKGMTIARVNCSHGGAEGNRHLFELLNKTRKKHNLSFKIALDTKGPEVRIGTFEGGGVELEKGQDFTLTTKNCVGDKTRVWVNYELLPKRICVGKTILLNDGMISLTVKTVTDTEVITRVDVGGKLLNRKALFAPGCSLDLPFLTKADQEDLKLANDVGAELILASFVGKHEDLIEMSGFLKEHGGEIPIYAKVESVEGVGNLDKILEYCDGVIVARGDLGVEYPVEQIPSLQRQMIKKAKEKNKIAIVATEMMESMIKNPRPTRAEVTDVTIAIEQGADLIWFSAETATGKYPLKVMDFASRIIDQTQRNVII